MSNDGWSSLANPSRVVDASPTPRPYVPHFVPAELADAWLMLSPEDKTKAHRDVLVFDVLCLDVVRGADGEVVESRRLDPSKTRRDGSTP